MSLQQILVISGKGGTGKTSVTSALAAHLGPLVIADTDVDAPDLHLVAGADPATEVATPFLSGLVAEVEPSACIACGACFPLCRFDALTMVESEFNRGWVAHVDDLACEGCGVCVDNCEFGAITEREVQAGELVTADSPLGPLVFGRLKPGQSNSGKLVAEVRQRARERATADSLPRVLIDGPPGVGCPVIAAMTGVDMVILVAEPTASSLHDLNRTLELAQHFGIPAAVIINKADLSPATSEALRQAMAEQDVPILGSIPYDDHVLAAQIQGQSVTAYAPDAPAAKALQAIAAATRERIEAVAAR